MLSIMKRTYFSQLTAVAATLMLAAACTAAQSPAPAIAPLPTPTHTPHPTPTPQATSPHAPEAAPRRYTYRVVASYPHDRAAFTQGLVYHNGELYESTGLYGQSSLRRVKLETGEVVQRLNLDARYFAEGLALVGERLIQLTWRERTGFVYDRASFASLAEWSYPTEGWGLTYDGTHLVMSDGSAMLRFLDPHTFAVRREVTVTTYGRPVTMLNELEYINGEVWANVWQTDLVVRINPLSGAVTGVIDFSGLLSEEDRTEPVDVLNGIAYDADDDRLFVTGKLWPKLFQVVLIALD